MYFLKQIYESSTTCFIVYLFGENLMAKLLLHRIMKTLTGRYILKFVILHIISYINLKHKIKIPCGWSVMTESITQLGRYILFVHRNKALFLK